MNIFLKPEMLQKYGNSTCKLHHRTYFSFTVMIAKEI